MLIDFGNELYDLRYDVLPQITHKPFYSPGHRKYAFKMLFLNLVCYLTLKGSLHLWFSPFGTFIVLEECQPTQVLLT